MSFLENLKLAFYEKKKVKGPFFAKEFADENSQIDDLERLSIKLKEGEKKERIRKDIQLLKAGIKGEKKVYFELKNSFIPFIGLHDIRIEQGNYVAQMDYVIITNKFILILETKQLSGDITINQDGDFTRVFKNKYGKIYKTEGIYSPISQNQRHVRILRDFLIKNKIIRRMQVISLVVSTNEKMLIGKDKCPPNIYGQIYRYDQITEYLKREMASKKYKDVDVFEKIQFDIAEFLIQNHKPVKINYIAKYGIAIDDYSDTVSEEKTEYKIEEEKPAGKDLLRRKLKEFRLKKAREEQTKAYIIFSNSQMEDLIEKCPKTKEELINVSGFGKIKTEKYGDEIIKIMNEN